MVDSILKEAWKKKKKFGKPAFEAKGFDIDDIAFETFVKRDKTDLKIS